MSFKKMDQHNKSLMKAKLKRKQWIANATSERIGVVAQRILFGAARPSGDSAVAAAAWSAQTDPTAIGAAASSASAGPAVIAAACLVEALGVATAAASPPATVVAKARPVVTDGRAIGPPWVVWLRGQVPTLCICSFGTRTLPQCFPGCRPAEDMRARMWPRTARARAWDINDGEACQALSDVFQRKWGLTFGEIGELHGDIQGHVGSHPALMAQYLEEKLRRQMQNIINDIKVGCSSAGQREHLIAMWCNAGEHRSVAVATLCSAAFAHYGVRSRVEHLCSELWTRRGCGCCRACDPHRPSTERDAAVREFIQRIAFVG